VATAEDRDLAFFRRPTGGFAAADSGVDTGFTVDMTGRTFADAD
jgi:hypothetical protein